PADQHLGPGREDVPSLSLPELRRRLGLHEVVDTSRATADLRLRYLAQLQTGYAAEELPRLRPYPLPVRQVAGVVVCRDHREAIARGRGAQLGQEVGNVAHLGREGRRALGVAGIVAEQVAVLLHCRPATGDVHHHRVDDGALESVDGPAGELHRLRLAAGVKGQGAAAPLARG